MTDTPLVPMESVAANRQDVLDVKTRINELLYSVLSDKTTLREMEQLACSILDIIRQHVDFVEP